MADFKTQYFPIGGGLDVVTPALSIPPGRALALVNFEPWYDGGYRRIDGFERFDGQPRPSEQSFTGFDVSSVEDVAIGATVTGGNSGATGVVIGVYEDDGSYGSDVLGVTKVTGTFEIDEELDVSATGVDALLVPNAAITDSGAVIASGAYTDIDEGVDFSESSTGLYRADDVPALRSIIDDWSSNTVSIPMSSVDAGATAINSWQLRVRARVLRNGPETDDLVTYRFIYEPGSDSQSVAFTQADAGAGWITRTITQSSSAATPAEVNSEDVILSQLVYGEQGNAADGVWLEVDSVDIVVDYDGPVVIRSTPLANYAPDLDTEATFAAAARDLYRADIIEVPGSGHVLGAWRRKADTFAVRNNVGNTAGDLHLASAAGWTTTGVTMTQYLYYTAGDDSLDPTFIEEGDTITGVTSTATATVHKVLIHSGAPGTADAAGYLVLTGVTNGPFTDTEDLTVGGNKVAEASGVNVQFAFPVGGKYRFLNYNFYATTGTYNVYGVNGVGPAFEIDEANIVSPILFPANPVTGQPADNKPFLLETHLGYLWLGFPLGRFIQSVIGEPLNFNGFLGAAEFGIGAELTGLHSVVGTVLVMMTEDATYGMFGTDLLTWELKLIGEKTGGKLYSTQKMDTIYGLDNLGITSIKRTQSFGSFGGATISQAIQPLIDALRGKLNDATIVRKANQYRAYFSDAECLIMYVPAPGSEAERSGEIKSTAVAFGFASYPFAIESIWNSEDENGTERTFFATTDATYEGYVFEDLVGTSFDGELIRSSARLAFNAVKSPSYKKHFRRADLELNANSPVTLQIASDLTYGSAEVSSGLTALTSSDVPVLEIFSGGGFWDVSNWDEFLWDGQNLAQAKIDLQGSGENIGFLIYNESTTSEPFILQSLTLHYSLRRLQR